MPWVTIAAIVVSAIFFKIVINPYFAKKSPISLNLGDSDLVQALLKQCDESYERRCRLKAKGLDLNAVLSRY